MSTATFQDQAVHVISIDGVHKGDMVHIEATPISKDASENNEKGITEPLTITSSDGMYSSPPNPSYNKPFTGDFRAAADGVTLSAQIVRGDDDESAVITVTVVTQPTSPYSQSKRDRLTAWSDFFSNFSDAQLSLAAIAAISPDPSVSKGVALTFALGGIASNRLAWLTSYLARDPSDPNYKVIAQPVTPTLPPLSAQPGVPQSLADAVNAVITNEEQAMGLATAIQTAIDRASGARDAGDTFWKAQQDQAREQFAGQYGALLDAEPGLLAELQSAYQQAGLPSGLTTLSATDITNFEQDIASNGLPAQWVTYLTQLGADSSTIDQMQQLMIVQDATTAAGDVLEKMTDPTLTAELRSLAGSMGPADPQPSNPGPVGYAFTHSTEFYTNFVTAAYRRYLGRVPDAAGLAGWVTAMQNGLSDERLEAGFIGSDEYIAIHGGKGIGWVTGLYQDLLGRAPDAAGLQNWLDQLAVGVDPAQVAFGFAASVEREAMRIQNDYQTFLGRSASPNEINSWVSEFLRGASNENVVAGFLASAEYYASANKGNVHRVDWIGSLYRDALGRQPSATEIQYWNGVLQ
jgi:hypothetical protein